MTSQNMLATCVKHARDVRAGTIVLLLLVFALAVCPLNAQALSDPFTDITTKGQALAQRISRPVLITGIVVVGCMILFGAVNIGSALGRTILGGAVILGAVGLAAWIG
jgi:hypothetical protein